MRGAPALLLASALLCASACSRAPPAASVTTLPAAADQWTGKRDAFVEASLASDPAFAVFLGRHEYDGRLTDYSHAALAREVARLHAARDAFGAVAEDLLTAQQRFERDYLLQEIDANLFWLQVAERPTTDPGFYADAMDPAAYLERPYAPLEVRLRAYIGYLRAVPQALRTAQENLKLPMPASLLAHGVSSFKGYADFYAGDARAVFEAVKDPRLREQLDVATRQAVQATREFVRYLSAQRPSATQDFAIGAEKFALMLRMTEGVGTPLAQLKAAGEADLARNLAAFKAACAEYAPRASPAACMQKARAHKMPGGVLEGAQQQLSMLRRFVLEHDVVSIPGVEEAQVVEAPPYMRDYSASISMPGPFEVGLPSRYYISPPDPKWSRKEQQDFVPGEATLLFTSVHEVWPGHFLQMLHANRVSSPVGRIYSSYAFVEGWAHYAEELMLEKGLWDRSAEARVGQLSEALLRDVRLVSAIGLHAEGMSLKQSEHLFVTQAFQASAAARQEAARGSFDPGYLNYALGKLMIRKLRNDWCASRGGEVAWKAFHDQFLSYGSPPIPLVRRAMLGTGDGALL
jgi:uncharacterized protein (DUF885 family)